MWYRRSVFFGVILVFLFVNRAFGTDCFVTGKTVNRNGRPVPHSTVFADTLPTGWEHLIVASESDSEGNFYLEFPCKRKEYFLFAHPKVDSSKDFVPIMPSVALSIGLFTTFAGIKLPHVRKGEVNLGNIRIPNYYKVTVKFIDATGSPILPKVLNSSIWLRIKSAKGQVASSGSLPFMNLSSVLTDQESELRMILPEGGWYIEVSLNSDQGPFLYPHTAINLGNVASSDRLKFSLKMLRKSNQKE